MLHLQLFLNIYHCSVEEQCYYADNDCLLLIWYVLLIVLKFFFTVKQFVVNITYR